MDDIIASARNYWEKKKTNCARAAACGILDYYKHVNGSKILYNAFTTFGGGLGERTVCGSLIGALGALNLLLAERGLSDKEIAERAKELKSLFREEFDTLECRVLLNEFRTKDGQFDMSHPERRHKCTRTVETAVTGVQQIIDRLSVTPG
ncbi:MAG: C-GCAxxG-C-C family (seleno)protein [Candidatus Hodarchaeales archaeon]|jgi:C_GCAxxG_C_C family probable redox protein